MIAMVIQWGGIQRVHKNYTVTSTDESNGYKTIYIDISSTTPVLVKITYMYCRATGGSNHGDDGYKHWKPMFMGYVVGGNHFQLACGCDTPKSSPFFVGEHITKANRLYFTVYRCKAGDVINYRAEYQIGIEVLGG